MRQFMRQTFDASFVGCGLVTLLVAMTVTIAFDAIGLSSRDVFGPVFGGMIVEL